MGRIVSGTDPQISSVDPERQADRDAIRAELELILSSHLFRNSKRCNTLLRYVVTEVLEGRGEHLKERTIGMSAFGREANYDTNEDTIVRTSAMEVRKRLAQYYQEIGPEAELRIDMASGSYVPEFRFLKPETVQPPPQPVETPPPPVAVEPRKRLPWSASLLLAGIALLAAVAAFAALELHHSDPLNAFWSPLWGNSDSVIVAAGTSLDEVLQANQPSAAGHEPSSFETFRMDQVGFADALTMARVSGLIQSKGRQLEIKRAAALTLDDLRKSPAVLVGAINNPWTMRLNAPLRFSIERDPGLSAAWIVDHQKNAPTQWKSEPLAPYSRRAQDWAVISRFRDPRTEQTVLLLAGLGRDGTAAAGEFVTQAKYLEALAAKAPAGWQHQNLQVVIGTDVINGNVGPPRILATYYW